MKFLNRVNIPVMFVFVLMLITIHDYRLPASIVDLYKSENDSGSYIVAIRGAPSGMTDAIQFWLKNKKSILSKTNITDNGKYILFVDDRFEGKSSEDAVQLCLPKQIKNKESCINYSSRLFTVTRKQKNGEWFYLLNQEDTYLISEKSCLFFDYDNGAQDYLGCDL